MGKSSVGIAAKVGLKTKEHQCVVWSSTGHLIGNEKEFSTYVNETYGVKTDLTRAKLVKIAKTQEAYRQC